jgi:selenocysteine-specific elongation factor
VRVSARTGQGLDALRAALDRATSQLPPRPTDTYFRLPVDRVFTLSGVGLLVTGTAWSGRVAEGDSLVVLPPGREARVRGVQVHGEKRQSAFAGERVALNLHGLKSGDVERGMLVATPGMLRPSYMLDVRLRLLESAERPLANRVRLRIHHGAAEIFGRAVLLDREALQPGDAAPAQLRLEAPLAAERGDLLVLRQYSPMRTLGGAQVLDPTPAKHKRFREDVLEEMALKQRGDPQDLVEDAVRRGGLHGATAAELRALRLVADEALPGVLAALVEQGSIVALGDSLYEVEQLARAADEVRRLAADYQRANPLAWGIGRAELQERLGHRAGRGRFNELLDGLAARPGGEPLHLRPDAVRVGAPDRELSGPDQAALDKLEALLLEAGSAPPLPAELQTQTGVTPQRFAAFVGLLEERGALVRVSDSLLYHRRAFDDLEARLRRHLEGHATMSMADFKTLTGLSRKYAVPLLEHFDRRGLTQRDGDNRRPGPLLQRR